MNRTMGARRRGQEGALAPSPSGNVVFCALLVTAKRSVDELCMHYFHNLSSSSGALPPELPEPPELHPWIPLGDFRPLPLVCPPLEKNSAGAHESDS